MTTPPSDPTPLDAAKSDSHSYVGRGGLKLQHALEAFGLDVRGLVCADFGCNIGGFTDCLLSRGAAKVYAVDTGYGALAWKIRKDPRVVVMERTNALHAERPAEGPVDLVVIDLAWTPQARALPAAVRWIGPTGRILTLIKPHYELAPEEKGLLQRGVLGVMDAERVVERVVKSIEGSGLRVRGVVKSPIQGGHGKGTGQGNSEWLAWIEQGPASHPTP